jgi:hypothetical protein
VHLYVAGSVRLAKVDDADLLLCHD